jgi:hypothetical protein
MLRQVILKWRVDKLASLSAIPTVVQVKAFSLMQDQHRILVLPVAVLQFLVAVVRKAAATSMYWPVVAQIKAVHYL